MYAILQQFLITFATFVLLRTLASASPFSSWNKCNQLDQTRRTAALVSSAVARLLEDSRVRVVRISGHKEQMIAVTRFVFPRTSIYIDFDEDRISDNLQNFIIAHELGHVRSRDPIGLMLIECFMTAIVVSIAIRLSVGADSIQLGLTLGPPVLLIGIFLFVLPASAYIRRNVELDADAFAAKLVGVENALSALRELRETGLARKYAPARNNIDRRISKIELSVNKTMSLSH